MSSMKFSIDASDFNKKLQALVRKFPKLAEKGMGRAMLTWLNDCIMEVPTVPVDEGTLRGSGSIFVQNKLVATSSDHGKPGKASTSHSEPLKAGELMGVIGFNTPYAARLHEGMDFKFKEPSAGPKFVESKMLRNGRHYLKEIADTIEEGKASK